MRNNQPHSASPQVLQKGEQPLSRRKTKRANEQKHNLSLAGASLPCPHRPYIPPVAPRLPPTHNPHARPHPRLHLTAPPPPSFLPTSTAALLTHLCTIEQTPERRPHTYPAQRVARPRVTGRHKASLSGARRLWLAPSCAGRPRATVKAAIARAAAHSAQTRPPVGKLKTGTSHRQGCEIQPNIWAGDAFKVNSCKR